MLCFIPIELKKLVKEILSYQLNVVPHAFTFFLVVSGIVRFS